MWTSEQATVAAAASAVQARQPPVQRAKQCQSMMGDPEGSRRHQAPMLLMCLCHVATLSDLFFNLFFLFLIYSFLTKLFPIPNSSIVASWSGVLQPSHLCINGRPEWEDIGGQAPQAETNCWPPCRCCAHVVPGDEEQGASTDGRRWALEDHSNPNTGKDNDSGVARSTKVARNVTIWILVGDLE